MKKGERRKQELLKIAYKMFLTKGYENTSVDDIIEAAGIAKGTYYYYFESKEQTLEEVIDMMLDAMVEKAEMVQVQDIPVQQKLIGVMMCFRPDESEATIGEALHNQENIVMHEKTNRKLIERAVPILAKVAKQAVDEGIAACDDLEERVKMILILSSALFDDNMGGQPNIDVFVDVIERILYAKPGTFDFIRMLVEGGNNEQEL